MGEVNGWGYLVIQSSTIVSHPVIWSAKSHNANDNYNTRITGI